MLRNKDKTKLKLRYYWPDDDPITKSVNKDADLFLGCLYLKEVEKTKLVPDIVVFTIACLEEVGRKDLVTKFQDLIKPPSVSAQQGPRNGTSTDKGAQGCRRQDTRTKQKRKSRARSLEDGDRDGLTNTESLNVAGQLKELNQQMRTMHQTIEDLKGKSPAYDSPLSRPFPFHQAYHYTNFNGLE